MTKTRTAEETLTQESGVTQEMTGIKTNQAVALAQHYTPPELLQLAILKKSDIAVIERMSALAERWQEALIKRESRIAFIGAMVAAKAEMPIIVKNRHVSFKSRKEGAADTDYWHEDLAAVVDTAQPVLAKHGLQFRWKLEQPGEGKVKVTCILEHVGGHSEETDITAGVDLSGNKNHIQAIKSVATYLERLTSLAIIGMAARGQDDDGRAGGMPQEPVEVINEEELAEIRRLLPEAGRTEAQFCKWAGIDGLELLEAQFYEDSVNTLKKLAHAAPQR